MPVHGSQVEGRAAQKEAEGAGRARGPGEPESSAYFITSVMGIQRSVPTKDIT